MPDDIDDDTDLNDDEAQRLLDADKDDDENRDKRDRGDEAALGDAGKRALDAMKRERNAARKELGELRTKLKSHEDTNKTDLQRLQEARDEAANKASKAEERARALQIAMDRAPAHATLKQVQAVAKRVRGESEDDLETDADELFELLAPTPKEPAEQKTEKKVASRPRERLRGGGDPEEEPEETDPRKLADAIRRRR